MVRAYSNLASHYYSKVRAIGIIRSAQTVSYKIFARIKKGDPNRLPFFDAQNFKAPDRLPFDLSCDQQLLVQAEQFLKQGALDWQGNRDIRIEWESARFQHAPLLAVAYKKTGDQRYLDLLKLQINMWLDQCPYNQGIHWFNAMEVGLRSISWIVMIMQLQDELQQDTAFYERLLTSLHEHMIYIERNWEWYDGRTSNHYLSNLVGYAYLCWFFSKSRKLAWCHRQLLSELEWQVFAEGASYEGSTSYHVFVTELFLHGFLIARDSCDNEKLRKMLLFIERCKPSKELSVITIGDDDSGIVMHRSLASLSYLAQLLGIDCQFKEQELMGLHSYAEFGLSLYRSDRWHISLRHAAYQARQPSGHFHADTGSITIAYNGVPIIIDPGSYIYSSSPEWRNFFRSANQHSTIHATGSTIDQQELFAFDMPAARFKPSDRLKTDFTAGAATINRAIEYDQDTVTIIDSIVMQKAEQLTWSFIFAPDVVLDQKDDCWHIYLPDTILVLESDLVLEKYDSWYAPSYGTKVKTVALRADIGVNSKKEYRSRLRVK